MESFRLVEIRKMANPLQAIQRMDKNQPRIKTTCLFDKSLKLLHSGEVDRVKYRKRKSKAIVSLSTTVRSFSYNLLRRNEFVEWHVAWLAEWHNYAECNICRIKKIKLKKLKIAPLFGANQYSQAATVLLWCCGLDYDDNQKARKDSLISLGRLAFSTATKILLAFIISQTAGGTDTTSRKSAIEERRFGGHTLFCFNFFLPKIFTQLTSPAFLPLFAFETVWEVFLFQTVGRVNVRDIMSRDRTYLVFCFLGLRDEVSGSRSRLLAEKRELESNRVCVLFVFLSFFLFFFFSFLLLAVFPLYLY